MPENGDPLLFPILATVNTIDLGLIIAMQAIFFSMLADLVEHSEVKTGRRNEGVFFSALTFIRKTNQGIGAFVAGLILQAVAFPEAASPADVPTGSVLQLGTLLVPSQWVLWGVMLVALAYYRLDRAQHQSNLTEIQARGGNTA
jgi:Na+/melibiose symporter-like transporter